jgi:predicted alpha/beta superfamily hydrolase
MKFISTIAILITYSCFAFSQNNKVVANKTTKPFVLGVIDEIKSKSLGENRILNIYLPEGYKKGDTTKYPVVYLLDGSADEDFIHIVGLFQFNNFSWIERVPKSIIVGIANIDRRKDFTYPTTVEVDQKKNPTSGQSAKFISFIENELQPFIEKKYNTNSSKMIIGQSLGGLLATEILLNKPTLFNKYIIVSPSLWWNDGSLLQQKSAIYEDSFNQPIDVFIAVGKEGFGPTPKSHVMEVEANLLAEKLKASQNKMLNVYYDYLPKENHATVTHQAVFNGLRALYPDK